MALDLAQTAAQVDSLASRLQMTSDQRQLRLERLLEVVDEAGQRDVAARIAESGDRPFLAAMPLEELAARHDPPPTPADFCVASVDGSHIDVGVRIMAEGVLTGEVDIGVRTFGDT